MSGPIGVLSGSWPPTKCGIGDFAERLALELARSGRQVVVVTEREARAEDQSGLTLVPLVKRWRPWTLPRVLSALSRHDARVLNLHYPSQRYGRLSAVDWVPRAVRRRLGIPVVTTVHEYTSFQPAGRARVRALVRASSAAIVPDLENLRALEAALPRGAVPLHHVPLAPVLEPRLEPGYDREAFRAATGARAGTLVLAYLGLISPSKGVDTLIDAFERLPASLDAALWVLADLEASEPKYEAAYRVVAPRLRALVARGRARWTGYLEPGAMSQHLAAADLAVLPYRDGASLRRTTLIAALAHGLPVLSCGASPPAEGIEVVPPGDAAALARAIEGLALDPARRAALGAAARDATGSFSWPDVVARTARVLEGATP